MKPTEQELAAVVVAWLAADGWEVFQEVEPRRRGICADIVARRAGIIWIIEAKLHFGLTVLGQAHRWLQMAHFVSVATPSLGRDYTFCRQLLKQMGIGSLRVQTQGKYVSVDEVPRLNRRILPYVAESLREEHKTFAVAGNNRGHRFTPFQATCVEIRKIVEANPGIVMSALMKELKHHYANDTTARACIRKLGEAGAIEGIRLEREGKAIHFYEGRKSKQKETEVEDQP